MPRRDALTVQLRAQLAIPQGPAPLADKGAEHRPAAEDAHLRARHIRLLRPGLVGEGVEELRADVRDARGEAVVAEYARDARKWRRTERAADTVAARAPGPGRCEDACESTGARLTGVARARIATDLRSVIVGIPGNLAVRITGDLPSTRKAGPHRTRAPRLRRRSACSHPVRAPRHSRSAGQRTAHTRLTWRCVGSGARSDLPTVARLESCASFVVIGIVVVGAV